MDTAFASNQITNCANAVIRALPGYRFVENNSRTCREYFSHVVERFHHGNGKRVGVQCRIAKLGDEKTSSGFITAIQEDCVEMIFLDAEMCVCEIARALNRNI